MPDSQSPLAGIDVDQLVRQAQPGGGSDYRSLIDQLSKTQKDREAAADPLMKEQLATLRAGREQGREAFSRLQKEDDAFRQIEKYQPKAQDYQADPLKAFGSWGSVFATIAAGFTHQPMVNALTAGGEAIEALKASDADRYKKAYDAWKDNLGIALDRQKMMHDEWQDIREQTKDDLGAYDIAIRNFSAKYNDRIATIQAEAGIMHDYDSVQNSRRSAALGLLQAMPEIEKRHVQYDGLLNDPDYQSKDPEARARAAQRWGIIPRQFSPSQALSADKLANFEKMRAERIQQLGRPLTGEEEAETLRESTTTQSSGLTDEAANLIADEYIAGNKQAASGFARSEKDREKIANAISIRAKERGLGGEDIAAMQSEYQGMGAGERTLGTRTAALGLASTELENFIPLAEQASKGFPRTSFPAANAALKAYEENTGDPGIRRFGAALQAVANAYSQVISRGAVAHDSDKDAAKKLVSTIDSPEAMAAIFDQIRKETAAAQQAPGEVRQQLRENMTGDQKGRRRYSAGDLITVGNTQYKVTGGDPYDPDVEEIK